MVERSGLWCISGSVLQAPELWGLSELLPLGDKGLWHSPPGKEGSRQCWGRVAEGKGGGQGVLGSTGPR